MVKVTYQIKTGEFEYIMFESEGRTHTEAVIAYNDLKAAYLASKQPQDGLNRKEWNTMLDALNLGQSCDMSLWERASEKQKGMYHEQEKSLARLQAKNGRDSRDERPDSIHDGLTEEDLDKALSDLNE